MNIFSELDYRLILKKTVEERRHLNSKETYQALAAAIRVQKSYLSKVFSGSADLNSDQLFLASEYLGFNEDQKAYLQLLLEHSRSGLKSRQARLRSEIEKFRSRFLETREHLTKKVINAETSGIADYYLDPLHQLVHMALTVPRYQRDLGALSRDLEVRAPRLAAAIEALERMEIVIREGKSIKPTLTELHLPRDSTLYRAWRAQLRQMSMARVANSTPETSFNFSVIFSTKPEIRTQIQALFLEFLKQTEALVKSPEPEHVYQMNFDIFSWTQ